MLPVCSLCHLAVRQVFFRDDRELCKSCLNQEDVDNWKKDVATHMRRDEYPGGIILENYGSKPIRFDSESERLTYMRNHGLEHREKWAPFPGTDKDPAGVVDSSKYQDPRTLANARELILRAAGVKEEPIEDVSEVMRIWVGSHDKARTILHIQQSAHARAASNFKRK